MSYARKVGRDSGNGRFIPVPEAREREQTAEVQHVTYPGKRKGK